VTSQLKQMRIDASLSPREMAAFVFGDPELHEKISKLEHGELENTLWIQLKWFYHCSIHVLDADLGIHHSISFLTRLLVYIKRYSMPTIFSIIAVIYSLF
jgi:hypothetical protein